MVLAKLFLPPANEVWEGYVFTGVCLSTGGEGVHGGGNTWWGVCMVGRHMWWGHAWEGACMAGGIHGGEAYVVRACVVGACMGGGCAWHAHPPPDTTRYGQWAGSAHPTGMHSCFCCLFFVFNNVINVVINKFKISFRQKHDIWGCLSYKIPWTEFSWDFVVNVIKLSWTSLYILTLTINFFQTIPMTQAKPFTELFNSLAENYFQQWSRSTKRANNNWRIAAYGPVMY